MFPEAWQGCESGPLVAVPKKSTNTAATLASSSDACTTVSCPMQTSNARHNTLTSVSEAWLCSCFAQRANNCSVGTHICCRDARAPMSASAWPAVMLASSCLWCKT